MPTGNAVLRAYSRALKRLMEDDKMTASAVSAGMLFGPGQAKGAREGYQVFVKVIRYSDAKLARNPESGGLAVKV